MYGERYFGPEFYGPHYWGKGGAAAPGPEIIDVLVRSTALGFFSGLYREIGEEFVISTPQEYSPYWMEFVDPIPASWVSSLSIYLQHIDQEMLEFGRPVQDE